MPGGREDATGVMCPGDMRMRLGPMRVIGTFTVLPVYGLTLPFVEKLSLIVMELRLFG